MIVNVLISIIVIVIMTIAVISQIVWIFCNKCSGRKIDGSFAFYSILFFCKIMFYDIKNKNSAANEVFFSPLVFKINMYFEKV